ncbi:eukaryotic translation initiation factor 4E-1A-like [Dendronephthya gigantea]|uniref:eukaryotic translation initiation factor 4E-1A-like n=1 Tax=Dendronephthya gigantea TaxID=151771 RepID=UPI00106916B3|nr:eukaryotic translation initiation factor 4E-1A-like [Dendronephthya gigantea]
MASGDESGGKEKKKNPKPENEPDISKELAVKHPLQNKWAWWFYKNEKGKTWEANLRLITTFDTVEDFWAIYNHIKNAAKLQSGCDYSVFKDGIKPMWEDERNKLGGRWLINSNRTQRADLDRIWLETLLCLVGEAFDDYSDLVCGTVVQIRPKMDKLAVWTGNAKEQQANITIGRVIKSRLQISGKASIGFQTHADTMVKTGSTTKNLYTV